MMDFRIGQIFGLMGRTLPFIVFRLLIYLGIGVGYMLVISAGAAVGYFITSVFESPGLGAGLGGLIGFTAAAGIFYWLREYILYLVKAGHIAVMVELFDGKELPSGKGQIDYAQSKVRQRFAETSLLFGLDRLIKGILHTVNRRVFSLSAFLPIPRLKGLIHVVNKVINISLTYTDEIIIAYIFHTRSKNP